MKVYGSQNHILGGDVVTRDSCQTGIGARVRVPAVHIPCKLCTPHVSSRSACRSKAGCRTSERSSGNKD